MPKLFLNTQESKLYTCTNHLEMSTPPKQVRHHGRRYTQLSLAKNLTILTRLAKMVTAMALTVLTLFAGLIFKSIRALWSEALSGRENFIIYTDAVADYKARMQALPVPVGYIGTEGERTKRPKYWNHLRLETGEPLPVEPEEYAAKVRLCFTQRCPPPKLPKNLVLPCVLLKTLRSGEGLRLLYKKKLIELEASHSRRYQAKRFEEQIRENIEAFEQSDRAGLDKTSVFSLEWKNPLFYYTLQGGGAAYTISYEAGSFQIREKRSQLLKELSPELHLTEYQCRLTPECGISVLSIPFSGDIEDCDIILNSKFLLFVTSNFYGLTIRKLRWDIAPRLQGKTLSQMKQLLQLAHTTRRPGSLEISLPC
ncbi:hypothetical protein [Estrella lausannensis]|uniref:Uncharacterized protein n=1 Tax=Estrella lausannensis TaxID=483423 RepID=A0A0H5DPQ9_9BACT|nr:hypothetical protein [Estrella lausannensis]CRX38566.1 hypothetical protein ELAC_1225 [Estrella lausannensis]